MVTCAPLGVAGDLASIMEQVRGGDGAAEQWCELVQQNVVTGFDVVEVGSGAKVEGELEDVATGSKQDGATAGFAALDRDILALAGFRVNVVFQLAAVAQDNGSFAGLRKHEMFLIGRGWRW